MPVKIAILLLNNYGDILYATPIAKQIKEYDYPGSHLTWIVSQQCSDILKNNGFIDDLDIIASNELNLVYNNRFELIEKAYKQKLDDGVYDKLFILQPKGKNFVNYKTCLRRLILDRYPIPIHVSLRPIVFLTQEEKNNVCRFVEYNNIESFNNKILFEFSGKSGQSSISLPEAIQIAEKIVEGNESTCVILSSDQKLDIKNEKIFNAQVLTFKENAQLINHCTLLVGCSSGITWLSTSGYCKPVPSIQFLKTNVPWLNSIKEDYRINNLDPQNILELYKFDNNLIFEVVNYFLQNGMNKARFKYDQEYKQEYSFNNFYQITKNFIRQGYYKNFLSFLFKNLNRGIPFVLFNVKFLCVDSLRFFEKKMQLTKK